MWEFHLLLLRKKEEDPTLPPKCTDHCLQPIRNRHNPELLFSNELLFEISLPYFLLKPNKHEPLSFVLQTYLQFCHSLLVPYGNSMLFPNKPSLLVK